MIVKDLQKYIRSLTDGKVPEKIGAENDPLLTVLVSETRDLESEHIKLLTDFATESNTQIFYELLQNAEDEKANQVFFYFDDENFVVINNGSPFYTDPKDSRLNRSGQLRGFLAKGRGGKSSNPNKIGEKGLGSKLLYDLLVNADDKQVSKKAGLIQSLIEDTKGLILFSWNNLRQWEQFVTSTPSQFEFKGELLDDCALLTKIIYAYYPSHLHEKHDTIRGEKVLFTQNELQNCLNYVQKIKSDLPQTSLDQGTLIYVPLGKEKAKKLKEKLDQGIVSGISGSMAFLENIDHATINQLKIKKLNFKKVELPAIERVKEKSKVTLAFPLAPLSINQDFVNFYKYLPVTLTQFGLKYIVNSKAYEIDSSRQHIKLEDDTKDVLQEISSNLTQYIASFKNGGNKEEYLAFVRCLLSTNVDRLKGIDRFYKEHFYDVLVETIKKNIPIFGGFSTNIDEVRIKNTELNIRPQDLGVSWQWLDTDLADCYEKAENILGIKKATILGVLQAIPTNNTNKIIGWVKGLSHSEYINLVKELADKTVTQIGNIPFIHCSDGEIRSINGIHTSTDNIFLTTNLKGLKPIFDKLSIKYCEISYDKLQSYEEHNIKKCIQLLNDSSLSQRDDKWAVFDVFNNLNQVPKLKIFENQLGEKKPLSLLLHNTSNLAPSGLLKRFAIKPSEIDEYQKRMESFMMQPESVWENLVENWDLHVTKDLSYEVSTKDLNTLYSKKLPTNTSRKPENTNAWIRTDTGERAKSSELFFSSPLSKLAESEYNSITELVRKSTSLKIVPFGDVKLIESVKFSDIPSFNFERLKNKFNYKSIIITRRELDVLLKIKVGDSLLGLFVIQKEESGGYRLHLKERNHKQYISRDRDLNAFLIGSDYHLLPLELETIFGSDNFLLTENEGFVLDLINTFPAERALVGLVRKQGKTVKERYLSQISRIEFNSQDSIESYDDTYESKVLEIAIELGLDESIGDKIVIDNQPLSDYRNSDEVKITTTFSQTVKFSLFQLLPKYGEYSIKLATIRNKVSSKIKRIFNAETYKPELIHGELPKQLNNPEQVAFLVAFYNSEKGAALKNNFSLFDFTKIDEVEVLDCLISKKGNLFYYSNLNLPSNWFNPKTHIDCNDKDLILDSEKVPSYIRLWMSSQNERKDFFYKAGLINEQSDVITLRKGVFRDEKVEDNIIKGNLSQNDFVQNTFSWIIEKENGQIFSRSSGKFRNIIALIKEFVSAKQCLPPLFLATRDLDSYHILSSFNCQNLLFINGLNMEGEKNIFIDTLKKHPDLNIIVNNGFSEVLEKNGIYPLKFDRQLNLKTNDFEVWNDPCYREWKKTDGEKYKINISKKEIPFKYSFKWKNSDYEVNTYNKGKTERHEQNGLIELFLFQENEENLYILLNDNMQSLFKNDAHLMGKLMNLKLIGLTENNTNGVHIAQGASGGLNNNIGSGAGNVLVDENKKEIINTIKEYDKGVLEKISDLDEETLLTALELLQQSKEKEEKSTPSELIGRIGEELAMKWLDERGLEPEHIAVTQNKNEYDILVPEDETGIERYIDVKTTTKSVIENDASVPLHIHKHAMRFLEEEADRNYFIIRISMGDLGIDHWNAQLKDRFNFRGEDRKLSGELIEAIRVKVNEFWEKPKNQKLFEKTVKKFKLTIPKMVLAEMEN